MGYCLKQEIEKRFSTDDRFPVLLMLMSCRYCKKRQNKIELDEFDRLFAEPIYIALIKQEHALFRAIGSNILDETADHFADVNDEQNEMKKIIEAFDSSVANSNWSNLLECLTQVSPSSYLRLMAKLFFYKKYETAFRLGVCFIDAKTNIIYSGYQVSCVYKDDKNVSFTMGRSINEGATEYFTEKLFNDGNYIRDAYYFEVEFYKKVKELFSLNEKEEGDVFFAAGGANYLYNQTKLLDKCVLIELLDLSDAQKWREVYKFIKNQKGAINNGIGVR